MPCTANPTYDFNDICDDSHCTGNCHLVNGQCKVKYEYMCNNHEGICEQQDTYQTCTQEQNCTWSAEAPIHRNVCVDPNVVVANGCAMVAGGQPLFSGNSDYLSVTTNGGIATTGDIIRIRPRHVEHVSSGIKVPLVNNTAGCFSLCLDHTNRSCPVDANGVTQSYCSTNCENTICPSQNTITTPFQGCGNQDLCLQLKVHDITESFPGIGELIDCSLYANPAGNFKFYNIGTQRGSAVCYYLTFEKALQKLQSEIRHYDNITLRALKSEGWYIGEIINIEDNDVTVINRFGEKIDNLSAMNVYLIDDFWVRTNQERSSTLYQQVFYNDGTQYGPLTLGTRIKFTEQNITKVGIVIAFNKLAGIAMKNTCPSAVSIQGSNNSSTDVGTVTIVTDTQEIHTFNLSSKTIKFLHDPQTNLFVERYGTTACGIKGIWGYEEDAKKRIHYYTGICNDETTLEGSAIQIWDIDLDFYFQNIDLGSGFSSNDWISLNTTQNWYNVQDYNRFEAYEGVQAGMHQHMCVNENSLRTYSLLGGPQIRHHANTPANKSMKLNEVLKKLNRWPNSTTPPTTSTTTNQYEARWHVNGCLQLRKTPVYSSRNDVKIACCATQSNFVVGQTCDPAHIMQPTPTTPTTPTPTTPHICKNILETYCQSDADSINSNICNFYGTMIQEDDMSIQNSITSYCQNRADCTNPQCTNSIFGLSATQDANGSDFRCSETCKTSPYNFYNCPIPQHNVIDFPDYDPDRGNKKNGMQQLLIILIVIFVIVIFIAFRVLFSSNPKQNDDDK